MNNRYYLKSGDLFSGSLVNLLRAAYYREENKLAVRDPPVVEALNEVVDKHSRRGFWKCHGRLRLDGHPWCIAQ